MRDKRQNFKKYLDELLHTVFVARANYEIWWIYKNAEDRKRYYDILDCYLGFFRTGIHAHFVAMIIALYKLFEKRRDTVNVDQLLKIGEQFAILDGSKVASIQQKVDQAKKIWKKVSILRNNVFAHHNKDFDYENVFSNANVTYDEIKFLTEITLQLLNDISYIFDRSTMDFDIMQPSPTIDTYKVLDALQRGNS